VPRGREREFSRIANKFNAKTKLNPSISQDGNKYFAVVVSDREVDDFLAEIRENLYEQD